MKKRIFNTVIYGAMFMAGLFLGRSVNAQNMDTITYRSMYMKDSAFAFRKAGSPMATTETRFPIFEAHSPTDKWLDGRLKKLLGVSQKLSLKKGVAANQKKYLSAYKSGIAAYNGKSSASLNYVYMQEVTVTYNANGLLILSSEVYDFSGGAHGNGGVSYYCYDVLRKKILQLSDIVNADSSIMQKLVEAQFRKDNGIPSGDSLNTVLFDNYLAANKNFYFTDQGLGFSYNPYEVAPYSMGLFTVFLPYAHIQSYLMPAFKKRMHL